MLKFCLMIVFVEEIYCFDLWELCEQFGPVHWVHEEGETPFEHCEVIRNKAGVDVLNGDGPKCKRFFNS